MHSSAQLIACGSQNGFLLAYSSITMDNESVMLVRIPHELDRRLHHPQLLVFIESDYNHRIVDTTIHARSIKSEAGWDYMHTRSAGLFK